MGYYVSHMFGIRTGGVFDGDSDMADLRGRIINVVTALNAADPYSIDIYTGPDMGPEGPRCVSSELVAHKGSYVVIGGVFNGMRGERADTLAAALSKEFETEVMHMEWDEETDEVRCNIWLNGKPLFEVPENPIGRMLRRFGG
jgi:hypothetical protein